MKKALFLFLFLLIPTVLAEGQAVISSANEFRIDLVRFDPTPATPGQGTDVWFEITNLKSQPLDNVQMTIVDLFPFTTTQSTITISRLDPGATVPFSFHLQTNKDIAEGDYKVALQFYSAAYRSFTSEPFTVSVQRPQQTLSTTTVTITPDHIEPGKEAFINVTMRNTLSSALNDVSVKLGLNTTGIPLAPLGSTSEQKITSLSPGAQQTVTFRVIALPDATANVYKLPLTLTYFDEFGTQIIRQDTIGIIIDAPATYHLDLEETTIHTKSSTGRVVISISNRGSAALKYLSVRILEDPAYDIISKNRVYIGNLDPDDFQTAEFSLYAKEKGNLKFMIDYKDTYNKEYQDVQNVYLPLYSTRTATRYGFITNNGLFKNLLTLLFIILLIVFVSSWIKMKNAKKAFNHTIFSFAHTVIELPRTLHPKNIKQSYRDFKNKKDD